MQKGIKWLGKVGAESSKPDDTAWTRGLALAQHRHSPKLPVILMGFQFNQPMLEHVNGEPGPWGCSVC